MLIFLVAAAVVFGAAVRTAGRPYTATGTEKLKGGSDFNGTSPRSEAHLVGLEPYSDILRDYCNFGDPICAVGSKPQDVAQHLNYFKLYVEDAAEWVVDTVQGNFGSRKNVTVLATTSSAATKATAEATNSVHDSQSEASGTHVEAVASTRTPESIATKYFVGSGGAAVIAIGYTALLFLL
jgi:acetylxylan esterase